ncbi:REP-associated tyrosine transposase [bacterium HR17]|uniref:REP-associated tyrosine transposase n=1 Tax=Candidatus Fervidibacter japonicus TaxID=2035412 RepID=A0A2H5XFD4_9BACT|nr:REP-associated tyrosine transposase [bacterium HR17]
MNPKQLVKMVMQNWKDYKTFRRRRSLRLPDFDYSQPYRCYHVIIGTYKGKKLFKNPALNDTVITTLRTVAQRYGYGIIAFCLMPDHLHVLVQAKENCQSLERFIGALKSVTTRHYWRHGGQGKLWQRGFYEHIVRRDEDLATISDYIMTNPVRSGLVEELEEYPWLGQWDEPIV